MYPNNLEMQVVWVSASLHEKVPGKLITNVLQ